MGLLELVLIAVGLAMDAFAVSVCKGLSMSKMEWKKAVIIGLYFGGFQALMPLIGYVLGVGFEDKIKSLDHWIAFILLVFIGMNMIKEAFETKEESNDKIDFKTMIILSIATSIDALAVGVTFAFLNVNIMLAISLIGIITFIISMIGVKIGNVFGDKYETKAELAGGFILIFLGVKILLEHLGILVI
ncbi:MAG TPA: manganese efflux pump [Candidatus Scatovivens faecipullorum]|nr:manganese efflux pump [Candidatus Scatovivens faecipullorum]